MHLSLSLSLSFLKVAFYISFLILFNIRFFLHVSFALSLSMYIVFFFLRDSLSRHIHLMPNSLIGLHTQNIWMEEYLEFGWTKMLVMLWPPACVVPEETSINIDGQDFGHQLVDCPTQSD